MELTMEKLQDQIDELKKEIKILKTNNTKKLLAELSIGVDGMLLDGTGNIFGINGGNLLPMKRRKSMKLK